MWFLFILRVVNKLKQIPIQADSYTSAVNKLENLEELQKYKDEWGSKIWILNCWWMLSEPKEI